MTPLEDIKGGHIFQKLECIVAEVAMIVITIMLIIIYIFTSHHLDLQQASLHLSCYSWFQQWHLVNLSFLKNKTQGHFYSLICSIIAKSTLVLSILKSTNLSYFSYSKLIGLTMVHTKNQIENVGREKLVQQVLKFSNFSN